MTNESNFSAVENTETRLSVHIITSSSSATILKIRNTIPGQKTDKVYIRLNGSHPYGKEDTVLLEMFLSNLLRMLRDTPSRKSLVSALKLIIAERNPSSS